MFQSSAASTQYCFLRASMWLSSRSVGIRKHTQNRFAGIIVILYIHITLKVKRMSKGLKRRGPCRGDPKSQFRRVIPNNAEGHAPRHRISMTMGFENHHSRFLSVSLGFLWLPSWILRSLGLLLGSPSWLSGSYIASSLDFSRFLSVYFLVC